MLSGASVTDYNGWVCVHRSLLKHPLMVQLPAEWFRVWIFILLRANFQPTTWWDGRREVSLPAGSFITSEQKLALCCKVSEKQIRGALKYFQTAGMVARSAASKYSILTVCKWEAYQSRENGEGEVEGEVEGEQISDLRADKGRAEGGQR